MLGLDFVKANREAVERAIREKGVTLDLDELLALDTQVRALKTEADALRAERNAISAKFPKAAPEEKAELGRKAKEAGARVATLEDQLAGEEAALKVLMLQLPGIPYEGAPVGPDESFNVVIRTVGDPPRFDFEPLDHVALIEKNGWGDLSRVTQVSGSRMSIALSSASRTSSFAFRSLAWVAASRARLPRSAFSVGEAPAFRRGHSRARLRERPLPWPSDQAPPSPRGRRP
jgi:seryl-tRNA synthetase